MHVEYSLNTRFEFAYLSVLVLPGSGVFMLTVQLFHLQDVFKSTLGCRACHIKLLHAES